MEFNYLGGLIRLKMSEEPLPAHLNFGHNASAHSIVADCTGASALFSISRRRFADMIWWSTQVFAL